MAENANLRLIASVSSLRNWTDTILHDSKLKSSWQLSDFKLNYDLENYERFYLEMMPFLDLPDRNDHEILKTEARMFKENHVRLSEAMKERPFFLSLLLREVFGHYRWFGRSANDLIGVLKDVSGNVGNLEYYMKIS